MPSAVDPNARVSSLRDANPVDNVIGGVKHHSRAGFQTLYHFGHVLIAVTDGDGAKDSPTVFDHENRPIATLAEQCRNRNPENALCLM